jgi:hypothetical protein
MAGTGPQRILFQIVSNGCVRTRLLRFRDLRRDSFLVKPPKHFFLPLIMFADGTPFSYFSLFLPAVSVPTSSPAADALLATALLSSPLRLRPRLLSRLWTRRKLLVAPSTPRSPSLALSSPSLPPPLPLPRVRLPLLPPPVTLLPVVVGSLISEL